MASRYTLSLQFAATFSSEFRYDIVHDAWLYYFEKTGTNLFTVPLKSERSFLYTIIKKAFYRWWYHERIGSRYIYHGVEDLSSPTLPPDEYAHYRMSLEVMPNPEITKLLAKGFNKQEVANFLGITKSAVGQRLKYHKHHYQALRN